MISITPFLRWPLRSIPFIVIVHSKLYRAWADVSRKWYSVYPPCYYGKFEKQMFWNRYGIGFVAVFTSSPAFTETRCRRQADRDCTGGSWTAWFFHRGIPRFLCLPYTWPTSWCHLDGSSSVKLGQRKSKVICPGYQRAALDWQIRIKSLRRPHPRCCKSSWPLRLAFTSIRRQ